MKVRFFILIFLLPFNFAFAQIVVDKVQLTETVDKRYTSNIPRVRDKSNERNESVAQINAALLDRFMIGSFDQKELEEFRWYEVDFEYEIEKNILFIRFAGEYLGAYPNYIDEELYFNLNTGEQLANVDIPFQALFSLNGYLEFINRYWIKKTRGAFDEAIECAGYKPYCSYYDIDEYSLTGNTLSLSLVGDCYSRASIACAPSVHLTISTDSLQDYLNDQGKKILFEDHYTSKKGVDKFLYNRQISSELPDNVFVFGKIDSKYPFSMALNFEKETNQISGYYYYDRKQEKIKLKGKINDDSIIELDEYFDQKKTGAFHIKLAYQHFRKAFLVYAPYNKSIYLSGSWSNPEKTRNFAIEFTEVKMNDRF